MLLANGIRFLHSRIVLSEGFGVVTWLAQHHAIFDGWLPAQTVWLDMIVKDIPRAQISKTYFTMRNPLFIRAPLKRRAGHAGAKLFPHSAHHGQCLDPPQSSHSTQISLSGSSPVVTRP
jgi:hypothetical protein